MYVFGTVLSLKIFRTVPGYSYLISHLAVSLQLSKEQNLSVEVSSLHEIAFVMISPFLLIQGLSSELLRQYGLFLELLQVLAAVEIMTKL